MKRLILLTIFVMAGSMIIWSQVPQAMNYKAIAKDDWGIALPSKAITLRFTILQDSETGSIAYQETHTTTTNKFGLMDVEIGKGTPTLNTFDMIDWSTGVYFIQIEMDPNGGTNFRLEDSAHQLLSVPYALFAESSGSSNYLESDPIFMSSPAATILNGDIMNWKTAFMWGNHAGLYRPIAYVPNWSEVVDKPIFAPVATGGSFNDLINKPTIDGSETKLIAGNSISVTGSGTQENPYLINSVSSGKPGNNKGDMLYWDGTEWSIVPVGSNGQVLTIVNGIPSWGSSVSNLLIGDSYQGGKVAYILQPGDYGYDANVQHGLIAAPFDQNNGATWGCHGTGIIGADYPYFGTGAQNTIDIVTGCTTPGIAAKLCFDLELNGYSDWYLPSKDELNYLYINKAVIGGFTENYYWSSTEDDNDFTAWSQNFSTGVQSDSWWKNTPLYVRAVRSF